MRGAVDIGASRGMMVLLVKQEHLQKEVGAVVGVGLSAQDHFGCIRGRTICGGDGNEDEQGAQAQQQTRSLCHGSDFDVVWSSVLRGKDQTRGLLYDLGLLSLDR